MAGLTDYSAANVLQYITGDRAVPALPSVFLGLFTAAPTSDAGTGGTEVSGGAYARVQVAGALAVAAAGGPFAGTTITLAASAPAWLLALGTNGSGVNVYDATTTTQIGTVSSISGAVVTLTGTAGGSVANSNSLIFSAFPAATASSGSEPATTPAQVANGAAITFPQATASWGNVIAFALFDASTSGNMLAWDYLGNFKWIPFSCTSASPGVLTTDASADVPSNGSSVIVSQKYGGTLPTTAGSWAGLLTTAGASGATFNAGVNTTSVGGGQFRQVTSQSIPSNVTASFAASAFVLTQA